jgi:hypothetical protein
MSQGCHSDIGISMRGASASFIDVLTRVDGSRDSSRNSSEIPSRPNTDEYEIKFESAD